MAARGIMLPRVLVQRYEVKEQNSKQVNRKTKNVIQELAQAIYKADEINVAANVLKIEPSEHIVPIIKQEPHDGSPEEGSSFGLINTDVSTEPVGVKRENEILGGITHQLVDDLPISLRNNQPKSKTALKIEDSWGQIEDEYHCNSSSENRISVFPQVEPMIEMNNPKSNAQHKLQSEDFNNSLSLVTSNVTVKLVDIFSKEARKRKVVHYNSKPCPCVFCRRVYKDQSNSHLLTIAFKNLIKLNPPNLQRTDAKKPDRRLSLEKNKLLKCPLCPQKFKNVSSLKAHHATHLGNYRCLLCKVQCLSLLKFENHMMHAHGVRKPFSCSICLNSFRTMNILLAHFMVHSDDRPFKCDVCPKSFKNRLYLTYHKQSVHMKEKSRSCNLCSAKFFSKGTLMDHMKSVHSNERPFDCKVCCKSFKLKSHLVKHGRMHSSEKPFKCEVCPATFRYAQSAKEHWRIHSDERPYRCSICSKSFKYSSHLHVHERRHTDEKPFVCHLCTATFKTRETIRNHIRSTHLGEKPKMCTICDFKTVTNLALEKHRRAHERMKQFKCPMCPLIFNGMKVMKNHVKITHYGGSFDCKFCEKKFYVRGSLAQHLRLHMKEGHIHGHDIGQKFFCAHCSKGFVSKEGVKYHLKKAH